MIFGRARKLGLRLSAGEVMQLIRMTADDLYAPGWDARSGWGRVNAFAAVSAVTADTIPPDVAVESSGDALLGSFVVKYAKGVSAATATGYKKVHITGTAYAASVEVHVKGPDEPMLARLGRSLGIK